MTTLAANYVKTEQIATPELYTFTRGSEVSYYTSWHTNITIGAIEYESRAIQRSGFTEDNSLGRLSVNITAFILPEFASYVANNPIQSTIITIEKAVLDSLAETVTVFVGKIVNATLNENVANIQCISINSILDKLLPRYIIKATCNHRIFDSNCGLLESAFKVVTTMTFIIDNTFVATGIGVSGYMFVGGYVRRLLDGDTRLITNQAGDTIKLHMAFLGMTEGEAVEMIPGCDGVRETCFDIYNNYPKFLGMAAVPTKNPCIYGA